MNLLTDIFQLNESGMKIFSIDDLQNAAEKSVQFSKLVKLGKFSIIGSAY